MWNALAGYGGMVSVGQQGFIGLGAYGTIFFTHRGVPPYLAMVLGALTAAALSLPLSLVVLRLRGGQFAIGTWVVAATLAILVSLDSDFGGGTGTSLTGLNVYDQTMREGYTYWLTLGFAVLVLGLSLLLLRSRHGTALQAIRDDGGAAASLGVRGLPDDPGQHLVHPAAVHLRRAMDRVHDLHGPRRRARHVRGPDRGGADLLRHPVRVRQRG